MARARSASGIPCAGGGALVAPLLPGSRLPGNMLEGLVGALAGADTEGAADAGAGIWETPGLATAAAASPKELERFCSSSLTAPPSK